MSTSSDKQVNIKFSVKLILFVICVFSLSLFFEAYRHLQKEVNAINISFMIFALILNAISLFAEGFIIYYEEKLRGNLKKKIVLFDNIIDNCNFKCISLKEESK